MRSIHLRFEDEAYPVSIGTDCTDAIARRLAALDASSYHLVTDATVNDLHAGPLVARLSESAAVHAWTIEGGEGGKTLATVERIAGAMVRAGADRRSVVVAMGGGMVGNVGGLIAALLFRGIRLVHVPTTLIAMADSVASLKQAVNLPHGKNLLGCFHTPAAVLIDIAYLATLPAVQIRSGLCEIIKNALIVCGDNLTLVEPLLRPDARYDLASLESLVEAGLRAKQQVMVHDRRERAAAIVFEYGHTVGHAIELAAAGGITHGEAVGLGMIVAAEVAHAMGDLSAAVRDLHYTLLHRNGTAISPPDGVTAEAVMALVRKDNKRGYVRATPGQVPMILLSRLGEPRLENGFPLTLVDAALVAGTIERHLFGRGAAAPRRKVAA